MRKGVLIYALAVFMTATHIANATSYFLDSTITGASDSNACTSAGASGPCATLTGAIGKMAAGDVLYIGSHHAETLVATTTYVFPGTSANPNLVFDVSDASWGAGAYTPVTADLTDPSQVTFSTIQATTGSIQFMGGVNIYGMEFKTASASTNQLINFTSSGTGSQRCDKCALVHAETNSGSITQLNGVGGGSSNLYTDLTVSFGNTAQQIQCNGPCEIRGAGNGTFLISGSSVPANPFTAGGAGPIVVDGVDLSASYTNLVNGTSTSTGQFTFRNCKLGTAGFSGATLAPASYVRAENVSASGTNYEVHWRSYAGSIDTDPNTTHTGGMTYNGTNLISYKMTGSANANVVFPVKAPPISLKHLASGSSTTITLSFLFDGANNSAGFNSTTLNNNQIWMRVGYSGTSGNPLNTFASNKIANLLPSTTAAVQGTAGGTWTNTLTTPEAYTMTLTFTPAIAGDYELFVEADMGANKTIWIDPQYTCTGNCS